MQLSNGAHSDPMLSETSRDGRHRFPHRPSSSREVRMRSIRSKLLATFALVVTVLAGVAAFAVWSASSINDSATTRYTKDAMPLMASVEQFRTAFEAAEGDVFIGITLGKDIGFAKDRDHAFATLAQAHTLAVNYHHDALAKLLA